MQFVVQSAISQFIVPSLGSGRWFTKYKPSCYWTLSHWVEFTWVEGSDQEFLMNLGQHWAWSKFTFSLTLLYLNTLCYTLDLESCNMQHIAMNMIPPETMPPR